VGLRVDKEADRKVDKEAGRKADKVDKVDKAVEIILVERHTRRRPLSRSLRPHHQLLSLSRPSRVRALTRGDS